MEAVAMELRRHADDSGTLGCSGHGVYLYGVGTGGAAKLATTLNDPAYHQLLSEWLSPLSSPLPTPPRPACLRWGRVHGGAIREFL